MTFNESISSLKDLILNMTAGLYDYQSLKKSRDFENGLARLERDSKEMEAIGIKLVRKMKEAIMIVRSLNDDKKLREWLQDENMAERSRLIISAAIERMDKANMELILEYQPELYSLLLTELIEMVDSLSMVLEDPGSTDSLTDFSLN